MYELMDADYNYFAVPFCVIVVVVVAFLGLQLFTSVLCTTSLEAKYVSVTYLRLFWHPSSPYDAPVCSLLNHASAALLCAACGWTGLWRC
jgi:hypothetical protein